MNPQTTATCLSLFVHAMFAVSALAIGRHTVMEKPPLLMAFSICQAAPATAPGPPTIATEEAKTSQAEKKEPPPTKKERIPVKRVAKITKAIAPPPPKKVPPAEKVEQIVQKEASEPDNSTPRVADKSPADSATTGTKATASSLQEPAKPNLPSSGERGGLFSAKELDGSLVVVKQAQPPYPRRARRLNIEGWIKVKFVVDEHGHVDQVTILAAKPEGIFEQSVLQCVDEWRFKPGTIGGRVVKTLVEQTITFKLEG